MIDSAQLLADLKGQLKLLEADLTARAEDMTNEWGAALRTEYANATARERTGLPWIDWRNGQVAQAAVAWILATVFIRFAEDNDLLDGVTVDGVRATLPWFAGPADRLERAVEHQSAYFTANPTAAGPDWLKHAFSALASLPAGRALVDPAHSPVWSAPISGEAADRLLGFWRATDASGALVRDFTDPKLDTRFLGDLYQDLSEFAKKQYALLQTPVFVEEFILDQTLTPAIAEFGLEGLKLIDPTCGSGHFLLGAFGRLIDAWAIEAPALDARERAAKALASVHGVDLNPFAVAIARFRLTVAALMAAGDRTLAAAPDYHLKLAIGDSLLGSQSSSVKLFDGEDAESFEYSYEDLDTYSGILQQNQYHVVVGNPPYITVKDPALKQTYKELYATCSGKWVLSVPFMELFFELAKRADAFHGAGYVGKITSNSFMKREFGKTLVERFLSGRDSSSPVDLSLVFDSAGAWIPGHNFDGTPTVIVFGRRRKPNAETLTLLRGIGEDAGKPRPGQTSRYWAEAVAHIDSSAFIGEFVEISEISRSALARHPWSLAGGGVTETLEILNASKARLKSRLGMDIGFASFPGNDEPFFLDSAWFKRNEGSRDLGRLLVVGKGVRDWGVHYGAAALVPYTQSGDPVQLDIDAAWGRHLWMFRSSILSTRGFGGETRADGNDDWWTWYRWVKERYVTPLSLAYAEVATHNHFVLDRGGHVFNQTAPIIKLTDGATEDEYLNLLGILNSSVVCFWLRQVAQIKGGEAGTSWLRTYQFNASNVMRLPLPPGEVKTRGAELDRIAKIRNDSAPESTLKRSDWSNVAAAIEASQVKWLRSSCRLIFEQEELDWNAYYQYGLIKEDLSYSGDLDTLDRGHRAFEIALARRVEAGEERTTWFERTGAAQISGIPDEWPSDYRTIVQRRLEEIASNPYLRVIERPDYKRRWEWQPWQDQLAQALRGAMLDHLDSAGLWVDSNGHPVTRTVNELADLAKSDAWFVQLATLAHGADADLRTVIGALLADESVPYLAALRYKPTGLEKFRAWERIWDLQRAEDRGERVDVPVPSKYGQSDFRATMYWKARGELDVPKERFIAYPGTHRVTDPSVVYGWAGWNHADRAQALARLPMELLAAGATSEDLAPLIGGLIELQPWLDQWHADLDPTLGVSPAAAISGLTDHLLTQLQLSRDAVTAWQPPAANRSRAASKGTK